MIAGAYSMHLYCENRENPAFHNQVSVAVDGEGFADIVGETWSDCARKARKRGWKIMRDKQTCFCPKCNK